jgi:DNA-binding transcriptional LysR family regulator
VTLEELRSFVEAVRRGSLSAAARALTLSQSAVSRHIQRLEAELGCPLLERGAGTGPASPTRAGLVVLDFAERTLAEAERMRERVRAAVRGEAVLEVASSSAPAARLVPEMLAEFRRAVPGVEVRLHLMNSGAVEACVLAGHCDVGFLGRPPRARRLRWRAVGRDRIVLAMAADHPLATGRPVALDALRGQQLVLRARGSGTREVFEQALRRAGRELPPCHIVEVEEAAEVLALVRTGQGVGLLSAEVCRGVPGLAWAEVADLDLRRDLFAVHDPTRQNPALRALLAWMARRPEPGPGSAD